MRHAPAATGRPVTMARARPSCPVQSPSAPDPPCLKRVRRRAAVQPHGRGHPGLPRQHALGHRDQRRQPVRAHLPGDAAGGAGRGRGRLRLLLPLPAADRPALRALRRRAGRARVQGQHVRAPALARSAAPPQPSCAAAAEHSGGASALPLYRGWEGRLQAGVVQHGPGRQRAQLAAPPAGGPAPGRHGRRGRRARRRPLRRRAGGVAAERRCASRPPPHPLSAAGGCAGRRPTGRTPPWPRALPRSADPGLNRAQERSEEGAGGRHTGRGAAPRAQAGACATCATPACSTTAPARSAARAPAASGTTPGRRPRSAAARASLRKRPRAAWPPAAPSSRRWMWRCPATATCPPSCRPAAGPRPHPSGAPSVLPPAKPGTSARSAPTASLLHAPLASPCP